MENIILLTIMRFLVLIFLLQLTPDLFLLRMEMFRFTVS